MADDPSLEALDVICRPLPVPETLPELELPNFGALRKAWGSLAQVPDTGDLLCEFQDMIAPAMASIRRWMVLQKLAQQISKCFQVIPDSIMTLSPDPIFDCIENLTKYVLEIVKSLPPLAYVQYGMTIARYCILFIDEIFLLLQAMNQIIADYQSIASDALLLMDKELQGQIPCAATDMLAPVATISDQMLFIGPAMSVLLEPFLLLPGGQLLKPMIDQFKDMEDFMKDIKDQIQQGGAPTPFPPPPSFISIIAGGPTGESPPFLPIPPLGPMVSVIGFNRYLLVEIYNFLKPLASGVIVKPIFIDGVPRPMLIDVQSGAVIGPPFMDILDNLPTFEYF